jgi:large subunit ribosomal protein L7A
MELECLKEVQKTVGAKQTLKALQRGDITALFVACDGEMKVIGSLVELAKKKEVQIDQSHTMEALGKACRIKVKAAAVGVLK